MSIRSTAKAVILHENKVLLDKCQSPEIGEYYALPGGGQNKFETMEEAVVRECLEETGYTVVPEAFVALYEEIHTSKVVQEKHPVYAHKIFHIFRCTLEDVPQKTPSEQDSAQVDCVWVDLSQVDKINLFPACVHKHLQEIIAADSPLYLGSCHLEADIPR